MPRPRALVLALLAVAVAALAWGARAGGMPPRDPPLHAPSSRAGRPGASRSTGSGPSASRTAPAPRDPARPRPVRAERARRPRAGGRGELPGAVAWYRTGVDVGADGDYAIRFESVNHRASVYVDGRLVVRHTGAYLPFEARTHLRAGRHVLLVRADWRSPAR